jgi:probable phosphoglycerate mutase
MAAVLLIRHAENEFVKEGRLAGRLPNVHLNQAGVDQATRLADKLKDLRLKAIYSSPLERTLETAQQICEPHKLDIIQDAGLLEVDYGEWQGKTLKSLRRRKLWKLVQQVPSQMRFPGGESFAEAQIRIVNALNQIATQYKPRDLLVCVSHSDMIKLAIAHYIGLSMDMFQRLHISPASISVMKISQDGGHLLSMNAGTSIILSGG